MSYLHDDEVTDLLEISDPSITTILTYSTRHSYCERNMRQAWTGASGFEKFGFCLVAGNAAYLDADERRRPLARTIREAVKTVKKNCEDREVWIGTEGVLGLARELAIEYGLTPFLLFDKSLESNIHSLRDRGFRGNFAVYVPFYISANRRRVLHDVLYRLSGYMLRRKWVREEAKRLGYDLSLPLLRSLVQEKRPLSKKLMKSSLGTLLGEAAGSLSVFGDPEAVEERLRSIVRLGPKVVVGLPIKESQDQISAFSACLNPAAL
jgi:alkanesulfonate monooxygenase SsuD/methylene tetrahydromethanopterin reductase-like flavin-dependent oxidoreductase (luciferase family)